MVHEWSVMVSDLLLAIFCVIFAFRIRRSVPYNRESSQDVIGCLVMLTIAATAGAFRHGFGPDLDEPWYAVLRTGGYVIIMMSGALLVLGVLRSEGIAEDEREFWRCIWNMKFVMASLFYLFEPRQAIIAGDWMANMVALGFLGVRGLKWHDRPQAIHICRGTGLAVLAGLVQHFVRWGTLNNDLCHLIMIPAMYEYHRAAIFLRDSQKFSE